MIYLVMFINKKNTLIIFKKGKENPKSTMHGKENSCRQIGGGERERDSGTPSRIACFVLSTFYLLAFQKFQFAKIQIISTPTIRLLDSNSIVPIIAGRSKFYKVECQKSTYALKIYLQVGQNVKNAPTTSPSVSKL